MVYIKRFAQPSSPENLDNIKYKNPLESYPMEFGIENTVSAKRQHIHKIKFHFRFYAYPSHRSMALIIIKHCHHMIFIKRFWLYHIPFCSTETYNCADCLYLLLLFFFSTLVFAIFCATQYTLQICMIQCTDRNAFGERDHATFSLQNANDQQQQQQQLERDRKRERKTPQKIS